MENEEQGQDGRGGVVVEIHHWGHFISPGLHGWASRVQGVGMPADGMSKIFVANTATWSRVTRDDVD